MKGLIGILAAASLVVTVSDVRAQCSEWLTGPLDNGSQANGANSSVSASFVWNSKLVIGGHFTSIEGVPVGYIAARDPVTGQWDDLAGGMGDQFFPDVLALTVYEGALIAAGNFDSAGGVPASNIARWDGSSWQALGGGLDGPVRALFIYNGDLIAGGEFANADGALAEGVARWDGSEWHAIGGGVNGAVHALGFYAGNLLVGGTIDDAGGVAVSGIASWNGATWSSLGGGLSGYAYAFSLFNGDLVVGGFFNAAGAVNANNIVRWNGSTWSTLGNGITPLFGETATVFCLTNVGGDVYAGGDFDFAGGLSAKQIARWNGSWQAVGSGTNSAVRTITSLGSTLVAGGGFTIAGSGTANAIARWDGAFWGPFGGGTVGIVTKFGSLGGRVVAAGDFHQSATNGVAHNVVRWDGVQLRAFGSGVNGLVEALEAFDAGARDELVVGGQFTIAGGVAASRIARWRENPITNFPPAAWEAMGAGFNNRVTAIERFNGTTYAGGLFTASGATAMSRVARWNNTTAVWEAMSTGMNGSVYALVGYNGFLYAGGSFTTASGVSTGGLARWNGSSWTPVSGIFSGTVLALEVHDGKLIIGGTFAGVGGSPNIVQYDGLSITGLGTGTNGSGVTSLRSEGTRLYVAGDFTTAGGSAAKGVAFYDGTWHEMLGGVDFPPVMALFSARGEIHVGGLFTVVGTAPAVPTRAWGRFAETGVPWIAYSPVSQTHPAGTTVNVSVTVALGYTPAYEWRKDDVPITNGPTGNGSLITGATTSTLVIHSAQSGDTGAYRVIVSSACGSVESFPATITIEGVVGVETGNPSVTTAFESIGPNPTGGPTAVTFLLAEEGRTTVRIYDVRGRLVRTLEESLLPAGRYRRVWDARNEDRRSVSAGVYFVSLEVEGRTVAKNRLVLLR